MNRTWVLLAIGLTLPRMRLQPVPPPAGSPSLPTLAQQRQPTSGTTYLDIVSRYRAGAFEEAVEALASHADAWSPAFAIQELEKADPEIGKPSLAASPIAKQMTALALAPVLPAAAVLHRDRPLSAPERGREARRRPSDRGADHRRRRVVDDVPNDIARSPRSLRRGTARHLPGHHSHAAAASPVRGAAAASRTRARTVPEGCRDPAGAGHAGRTESDGDHAAPGRASQEAEPFGVLAAPAAAGVSRQGRRPPSRRVDHRRHAGRSARAARARPAGTRQAAGSAPRAGSGRRAPPPAIVHYFASMFLGKSSKRRATSGAIARYRETVKRWPECQSAHLALSRAFEATGDRRAAADALQPLWRAEADRKCVDPWWLYNEGNRGACVRSSKTCAAA